MEKLENSVFSGGRTAHCDQLDESKPAKGLEVQVHHLISLGGWNDVIHLSIYLSLVQ